MKLRKDQIQNLLLLVLVIVVLFTPLGTQIKVQLNRLFSFAPSLEPEEDRAQVSSYDWSLQSIQGEAYNLEKAKGAVVLINFWATWCPPCIAEMPSMQQLYNSYGDKVVFVFVSQESPEVVQAFMDKHQYKFPVYQALSTPPAEFDHQSIPTTYLVGKTGEIVIDKGGAANWNSESVHQTLDRLLGE